MNGLELKETFIDKDNAPERDSAFGFRVWDFGFLSDFGPRISDFGDRILALGFRI